MNQSTKNTQQQYNNDQEKESILGLSTNELAGLTVDEILENKTAITMLMHYYKNLLMKTLH